MLVRIKLAALQRTEWWEYAVRFVFGGLSTALAGLVASHYGPAVGGFFLAFPAIFCASVTLVERHERKRKEDLALAGRRRGCMAAALDAAGAVMGSLGLIGFGAAIWWIAPAAPVVSLLVASAVWTAIVLTMWWLRRYIRMTHASRHRGTAAGPLTH